MSGNTNSYAFQQQKRERIAKFQKEMDKYGLKVNSQAAVFSTSYQNTVNLVMTTEITPVRGYGKVIKQLKAAGYWVSRWSKSQFGSYGVPRQYVFQVNKVVMLEVPDEMEEG